MKLETKIAIMLYITAFVIICYKVMTIPKIDTIEDSNDIVVVEINKTEIPKDIPDSKIPDITEYYKGLNIRILFDAMYMVESSGGKYLIGDDGQSLGPYQIQKPYWQDAVEYNSDLLKKDYIEYSYQSVYDREYAEEVMKAYWDRYAPDNVTYEILARIHNGGPKGHLKSSTYDYWEKVEKYMEN